MVAVQKCVFKKNFFNENYNDSILRDLLSLTQALSRWMDPKTSCQAWCKCLLNLLLKLSCMSLG